MSPRPSFPKRVKTGNNDDSKGKLKIKAFGNNLWIEKLATFKMHKHPN